MSNTTDNTIVWTTSGYYGNKALQSMKIAETVIATVRHFGKGQITVKNITWAINMQLGDDDKLTEAQVQRVLAQMARAWRTFRSNGNGVYSWS